MGQRLMERRRIKQILTEWGRQIKDDRNGGEGKGEKCNREELNREERTGKKVENNGTE